MIWTKPTWPVSICLGFLLIGCSSQPASPLPASPFNLVSYLTQTPEVIPAATLPATEIPSPTPTPQVYIIASGDTLSKISQQFGVSLEFLQAANPNLQPTALIVGQTLVIPSATGPNPAAIFLPTPVALDLGPVNCLPTLSDLTCFAPVHNPRPEAVENLQVLITLIDETGQPLENQEALIPLNILPANASLPATAHFQKASSFRALSQLQASLPISADDQRYLPTRLDNLLISIDWNQRSAQVEGQILLAEGAPAAQILWLAATAYDANQQMIGFRRWEWQGLLQPGQAQPFSLRIYSLGPAINQVEVQVEARP